MLLLSREDIKKVFSIQDAIVADKKAFTLVADKKCDSPLRTNIQAPKYDGCFLFMPAYIEEMDTAILPRASKIYFDSQEAVLSESGDILLPLEEGIITEEDFTGNIGDVIKGTLTGRENDDEIIVYETVGVGAQDLVTAKTIYEKALAAGVGMQWEA